MAGRAYLGQGKNFGNTRLSQVADGTNPTDAVTLQQVQALLRGASWKGFARAASTANVSLTAPGATIDGVTLVSGDVVLLKNQTAGAENGLYVWTGSAATLTRTADAATAAQLKGAAVLVTEGTVNADKSWIQSTDNITLGTTALVWNPFGGGGSAYTGGNGVLLTGSSFSAIAGAGIVVDGTGIRLDTAVAVRKYAASIGDGTTTAIPVTHGLGTTDVQVELVLVSTGETIDADIVRTSASVVTISFATAPASNSIRIIVQA